MFADIHIVFLVVAVRRFAIHNHVRAGIEPYDAKTLLYLLFVGCYLGISLMFVAWYGFFQCWLNGWAEILRFGDRMFYDDWWTSGQYSRYFRKWNLVVSDWLHSYLYQPMYNLSGKKWIAALSTFMVSAIYHEYIMALTLGFVFPLLFILFSTGIIMFFLTQRLDKEHVGGNTFLFASFYIGYSLFVMFYPMEWYSRINCPQVFESQLLDKIVPRLLTCIKIKF
ncbi:sterol O-acyltransferase 1-like protein, partial [Dinothrombium tinctorium]